jgi:hypothetical protein
VRYRKVDPRIWNDEKFRALSVDGKFVFFFILTHPAMTALGAMRATLPGHAAELGCTPRRFREAILPAVKSGMVELDEGACFIGLPKFLRYNEPESPNSVKSWVGSLDQLPECVAKRALIARAVSYLEGKSEEFRNALGKGVWEAVRLANEHGLAEGMGDSGAGGRSRRQEAATRRRSQEARAAEDTPPVADSIADETSSLGSHPKELSAQDWLERELAPLFKPWERGKGQMTVARRWIDEHNPDAAMRVRILACKRRLTYKRRIGHFLVEGNRRGDFADYSQRATVTVGKIDRKCTAIG